MLFTYLILMLVIQKVKIQRLAVIKLFYKKTGICNEKLKKSSAGLMEVKVLVWASTLPIMPQDFFFICLLRILLSKESLLIVIPTQVKVYKLVFWEPAVSYASFVFPNSRKPLQTIYS